MATRKVYVKLESTLVIEMEEGIELQEVINEMDYSFTSQTNDANIIDLQIENYEITDSK